MNSGVALIPSTECRIGAPFTHHREWMCKESLSAEETFPLCCISPVAQ